MVIFFVIFFCKQKPAYDVRIIDWSSDVCSSDLRSFRLPRGGRVFLDERGELSSRARSFASVRRAGECAHADRDGLDAVGDAGIADHLPDIAVGEATRLRPGVIHGQGDAKRALGVAAPARSEEHTSEIQSLMRHSYAVFCLKKKIQ